METIAAYALPVSLVAAIYFASTVSQELNKWDRFRRTIHGHQFSQDIRRGVTFGSFMLLPIILCGLIFLYFSYNNLGIWPFLGVIFVGGLIGQVAASILLGAAETLRDKQNAAHGLAPLGFVNAMLIVAALLSVVVALRLLGFRVM